MSHKLMCALAILLGFLGLLNGLFMLVDPELWYWTVPGVPERGPFNQHFVRDIGFTYILLGLALIGGAFHSGHRFILWAASSAWLTCHAFFHFWEVYVGICGPDFLIIDFGGVTLPAVLSLVLVTYSLRVKNG